MEKIGFIGLGRMGRPMASNLRKHGFDLSVFDINPDAVRELVDLGATAASDISQIARSCTIVITMLPTSVEVEHVALGEKGVFANARKGTVLLDMSTIDPLATDRLHAHAQKAGMSVVDAPVGRLAEHADRGESLFMVGASDADFARVDVAQLKQYADPGVNIEQGHGAVRGWVDIARGRVTAVTADLALMQVAARLDPQLEPLQLATLSGRLSSRFRRLVLCGRADRDSRPNRRVRLHC